MIWLNTCQHWGREKRRVPFVLLLATWCFSVEKYTDPILLKESCYSIGFLGTNINKMQGLITCRNYFLLNI